MFYSVNSYSSIGSRKGITGLASGLENVDEIVQSLTSGTRAKITKQLQEKQLASWRQEAYRTVISSMQKFQNKYLSTSAGALNIMSSKFFNSSKITSSSPYAKVSGSTEAAKNIVIKDIKSLAETASFTSSKKLSSQQITTGKLSDMYAESQVSGSSIKISINGVEREVAVSSDFKFDHSMPDSEKMRLLAADLNKNVAKDPALKGILQFSTENGSLTMKSIETDADGNVTDGTAALKILEGSDETLLKAGGFSVTAEGAAGSSSIAGTNGDIKVAYKEKSIGDILSGSSLTFNFNGQLKNIVFNETDKASFNTVDDFKNYLQHGLDRAFGNGKVSVTEDNGKLNFKTSGEYDTFSIAGSDKTSVLSKGGLLGIHAGTSTRISWNTSVKELVENGQFGDSATMKADADGNYKLKINDTVLTINESMTMTAVKSLIDNSNAGVRLSYSTTSDTFSLTAKDSGANGNAVVGSVTAGEGLATDGSFSNDLGVAFFGTAGQQTYTRGRDAELEVSFDGGRTSTIISRSTNTLSLDGLTIELTGKEAGEPINLAGKKLTVNIGGVDKTVTLPSDFNFPSSFTASDRERSILEALNTQLGGEAVFSYTSDRKNYVLMSTDGSPITIDYDQSDIELVNAIGFQTAAVNADRTAVFGTGTSITETEVAENISFTVESSTDEVVDKIKDFLKDYNEMVKTISDLVSAKRSNKYQPLTDEQKKEMSEDEIKNWEIEAKKGILANDETLSNLLYGMRTSMMSNIDGLNESLYKIGISTSNDWTENGQLHLNDEDKLRKALSTDLDGVMSLFTKVSGEGKSKEDVAKSGLATRLSNTLSLYAGTFGGDGILIEKAGKPAASSTTSQDILSRKIRSIDVQLDKLKRLLLSEEERHYAKFSALEKYISNMNSQSAWLSSQFGGQ